MLLVRVETVRQMKDRNDFLSVVIAAAICLALGLQLVGSVGSLLLLASAGLLFTAPFLLLAAVAMGEVRWSRKRYPDESTTPSENQVLRVWRTLPDVRPEPFSSPRS